MPSSSIARRRQPRSRGSPRTWGSWTRPCRGGSRRLGGGPRAVPAGLEGPLPDESPQQELARLRSRVCELEDERRKLNTEREILRATAEHLAGETNW